MDLISLQYLGPDWQPLALLFAVAVIWVYVLINLYLWSVKSERISRSTALVIISLLSSIFVWLMHHVSVALLGVTDEAFDYIYSLAGVSYLFICFTMIMFIIARPGPLLLKWLLVGGGVGCGVASSYYFILASYKQVVGSNFDLVLVVLSLVVSVILVWLATIVAVRDYKKKAKISLKSKLAVSILFSLVLLNVQQIGAHAFSLSLPLANMQGDMVLMGADIVAFYMATISLIIGILLAVMLKRLKVRQRETIESIYPDILIATGTMVVLGAIVFSQWHNSYAHEKEVSLFYLQQQIDRRILRAHLWLEELRNGSETAQWENDVMENLLMARKYVRAIKSGELVDEVFFYRATDENMLDILDSIEGDIEKWYQIVVKHKMREHTLSNEFYTKLEDHVFATIDLNLAQLRAITERATQEEWARVKLTNYITLACVGMLLMAIFRIYYSNKSIMNDAVGDLESALNELKFQKTALDEHAIVTVTDRKGNITYSNKKFTEISQYSPDELLGKNHRVLNSGYHSREFFKDLWLTINHGKIWRGSIRNRRKNGEFYWVDTTIVPFLDEMNKPYQFISIRNDITLVKEAEEQQRNINQELERRVTLRTAELAEINRSAEADREALQLMVEGTSTATGADFFNLLVKYLATVLRVEYVAVVEQLHTMPFTGRTIAVRAHNEYAENFEYCLEGTPCEEVIVNRSAIYARALNDTYKNIPLFRDVKIENYMGVPMSDSRGRILGHIAAFDGKEFADKQRLKSIMRIFAMRAASELERQHVEEQLKKARDRAVAASRSKSEFLANMSHELRTPMHAILSFAAMGKEGVDDGDADDTKHCFQRIQQSGGRLMGLLNDLLDLSKLNAGKMLFEFVEADLAVQVGIVVGEYEAMAEAKNIDLKVEPPSFGVVLSFDKERLDQVVRNLISNAIKFTPEGKSITIKFTPDKLMGLIGEVDAVTLEVVDQGVGVPEEEHFMIFEQFQQSSRTNRNAGGTGLGLAICKEIVSAHNGEIKVADNPEGGAIFQVTLPKSS